MSTEREVKHKPEELDQYDNPLELDQYDNPLDGSRLINCCFPDCGCDGSRLCQAENGPNLGSCSLNLERGSSASKARKEQQ